LALAVEVMAVCRKLAGIEARGCCGLEKIVKVHCLYNFNINELSELVISLNLKKKLAIRGRQLNVNLPQSVWFEKIR